MALEIKGNKRERGGGINGAEISCAGK